MHKLALQLALGTCAAASIYSSACGPVLSEVPEQDVTYMVRGIIMLEYDPGPPCRVKVFVDGYTHEYLGHFGCASRSVEVQRRPRGAFY